MHRADWAEEKKSKMDRWTPFYVDKTSKEESRSGIQFRSASLSRTREMNYMDAVLRGFRIDSCWLFFLSCSLRLADPAAAPSFFPNNNRGQKSRKRADESKWSGRMSRIYQNEIDSALLLSAWQGVNDISISTACAVQIDSRQVGRCSSLIYKRAALKCLSTWLPHWCSRSRAWFHALKDYFNRQHTLKSNSISNSELVRFLWLPSQKIWKWAHKFSSAHKTWC